jgi:hypothetical protein
MTTAINAAINPYSMAVAPLSFFPKRVNADIFGSQHDLGRINVSRNHEFHPNSVTKTLATLHFRILFILQKQWLILRGVRLFGS